MLTRYESDLDTLATFESASACIFASQAPTRYAVRQVLDQELQKTLAQRDSAARQARLRGSAGGSAGASTEHAAESVFDDKENKPTLAAMTSSIGKFGGSKPSVKKDFFGRVVVERPLVERDRNAAGGGGGGMKRKRQEAAGEGGKVWVTFHEGLNNAVRKPISLDEFLRGF